MRDTRTGEDRRCARPGCDQDEFRIDGYCSIYCRDMVEEYEDGYRAGLERARTIALVGDIWELPCSYPDCKRGAPSVGCDHGDLETETRLAVVAMLDAAIRALDPEAVAKEEP